MLSIVPLFGVGDRRTRKPVQRTGCTGLKAPRKGKPRYCAPNLNWRHDATSFSAIVGRNRLRVRCSSYVHRTSERLLQSSYQEIERSMFCSYAGAMCGETRTWSRRSR